MHLKTSSAKYPSFSTGLNVLIIQELIPYINSLVQDCSNSSANALELLQSCTKPLIYGNMHCLHYAYIYTGA